MSDYALRLAALEFLRKYRGYSATIRRIQRQSNHVFALYAGSQRQALAVLRGMQARGERY